MDQVMLWGLRGKKDKSQDKVPGSPFKTRLKFLSYLIVPLSPSFSIVFKNMLFATDIIMHLQPLLKGFPKTTVA